MAYKDMAFLRKKLKQWKMSREQQVYEFLACFIVTICVLNVFDFFFETSWPLLLFSSFKVFVGVAGFYTLRKQDYFFYEGFIGFFVIAYVCEAMAVLTPVFLLKPHKAAMRWCAESMITSHCRQKVSATSIKVVAASYLALVLIYVVMSALVFARLRDMQEGNGNKRFMSCHTQMSKLSRLTRVTCRWLAEAWERHQKLGLDADSSSSLAAVEIDGLSTLGARRYSDMSSSSCDRSSRHTPDRATKVTCVTFRDRVSDKEAYYIPNVSTSLLQRRGAKAKSISKALGWTHSLPSSSSAALRSPVQMYVTPNTNMVRSNASVDSNFSSTCMV